MLLSCSPRNRHHERKTSASASQCTEVVPAQWQQRQEGFRISNAMIKMGGSLRGARLGLESPAGNAHDFGNTLGELKIVVGTSHWYHARTVASDSFGRET
jgi:TfoX/Sxy family transcriptional regulator of competence genes